MEAINVENRNNKKKRNHRVVVSRSKQYVHDGAKVDEMIFQSFPNINTPQCSKKLQKQRKNCLNF